MGASTEKKILTKEEELVEHVKDLKKKLQVEKDHNKLLRKDLETARQVPSKRHEM